MTFEWKGRAFVLHRELDTRKSFSKFVIRSQIHATVDRIDANATLGETPFDEEVRYPIVDIDRSADAFDSVLSETDEKIDDNDD